LHQPDLTAELISN